MAPPGAIAHSRHHPCPRASSILFLSSFVSPLLPLGLGLLLVRGYVRRLTYFYDVTDAGPASHRVRLWQGGPASTIARWLAVYSTTPLVFAPFKFAYWLFLKIASAPGPFGGRGEMAMAVASSARLAFLRGAVCACCMPYTRCFPFWSLYSDSPMSSRPQPLGRGGDVAPCEDTREDLGPWFKCVAGCLLMVPHVLCSPAAGTTFQLLPVGREGCRVVLDMCKGFNGRRTRAQRSKPNGPEPAMRRDRWGE